MSGVFADYQGPGSLLATQMAAEYAGGHAGLRPVEVVFADHHNKPDTGMAIVRRWLDQEGVHVVMDVPNSAIALAVAQFVTERNRVFIGVGAGIADLTGPRCTPNIVHWDYDTWETSHALGQAITDLGGKTWFTLRAKYSFGADLDRNVTQAVVAAGGKVLGGVKAPFPTSDFSSFLLDAQGSGAQVLALNNAGGDTTASLEQAAEFGLTRSMKIAGAVYNINVTKAIGLQVAKDVMGAMPYSLAAMIGMLPPQSIFCVSGIGPAQLPGTTQAILLGGHVRVGLEDNNDYSRGQLATNQQLVARTVRIINELNMEVASAAEARDILGLPQQPRVG